MKTSLFIVGCFVLGTLGGYADLLPEILVKSDASTWALYGLMFMVGLNLGSDRLLGNALRSLQPRVLLIPLATILGSILGAALISLAIDRWTVSDCMAVGSGLAYYSLSSVLIVDLKQVLVEQHLAAALGTVALMSNIMRELITLIFAPLLARFFGPLAPICAGGATTMDTTLPIITYACGKDWTLVALVHGVVTTLLVPLLVSFFCWL